MKKLVVMASLVAASTSMMAMEISPFVGLDFVKAKVETNEGSSGTAVISGVTYTGSGVDSETINDNTVGIKAGAIVEKNHRVYINYYKLEDIVFDNKVSYTLPSINYDYLIINDKLNGFIPYIGAHIGYGKTNFGDFVGQNFEDKSSFDYGLNLGIMKDITENISLELGYRYTKVDQKSEISGSFANSVGDTLTGSAFQENESVQAFTFGINYKF